MTEQVVVYTVVAVAIVIDTVVCLNFLLNDSRL